MRSVLLSLALFLPAVLAAAPAFADGPPAEEHPDPEAFEPGSWAVRGHLVVGAVAEGIDQGVGRYPDAGLAGAGLALRTKLDRHFALQLEGDMLGGLDLAAHPRLEAVGLGSLLLFLNPDDPLQVFLEASLGADVSRISTASGVPSDAPTYTYFNAVGGGGLGAEWRVLRRFALVGEARGLLRGRVSGLSSDDTLMRDGQGHEAVAGAMLATLMGARYEF
jgi:hypothetical protein